MDTNKAVVFMHMAAVLSSLATCARRKVGVIMTDSRNHIIASGYNGNAAGLQHCIDSPCSGATLETGKGLDECLAIHAEQNALMQCKDVHSIVNVFTTTMPCTHCLKMLMNTSAINIYYMFEYGDSKKSIELWSQSRPGRQMISL